MIVYFDSSSIVKWFFDEPYRESARAIKEKATSALTSLISFSEVISAVNRAFREGRCLKSDMEEVRAEFLRVWPEFRWIKVDGTLIQQAGHLVFTHNLRGFNAVHLASALLIREEVNTIDFFFSSFDRDLNRAAQAEGFLVHENFS